MKEYVKPEFFYENYELNMSVASCDSKIDRDVYEWDKEEFGVFALGDCAEQATEAYGYYGGTIFTS